MYKSSWCTCIIVYRTLKEHNGHNHDTAKKMATKHHKSDWLTASVDETIRGLSEAHDNIDKNHKMKKKIRQQGDEVDKKIDQYYDELVQKLMKQKEQLKQQAHDAVSQKQTVQLEKVE